MNAIIRRHLSHDPARSRLLQVPHMIGQCVYFSIVRASRAIDSGRGTNTECWKIGQTTPIVPILTELMICRYISDFYATAARFSEIITFRPTINVALTMNAVNSACPEAAAPRSARRQCIQCDATNSSKAYRRIAFPNSTTALEENWLLDGCGAEMLSG